MCRWLKFSRDDYHCNYQQSDVTRRGRDQGMLEALRWFQNVWSRKRVSDLYWMGCGRQNFESFRKNNFNDSRELLKMKIDFHSTNKLTQAVQKDPRQSCTQHFLWFQILVHRSNNIRGLPDTPSPSVVRPWKVSTKSTVRWRVDAAKHSQMHKPCK